MRRTPKLRGVALLGSAPKANGHTPVRKLTWTLDRPGDPRSIHLIRHGNIVLSACPNGAWMVSDGANVVHAQGKVGDLDTAKACCVTVLKELLGESE